MLKNMGMDNPNTEKYLRAWFSGDYAVHMQLDSANMLQSNMEEGDWCFLPEIGFERFGSELHLYLFGIRFHVFPIIVFSTRIRIADRTASSKLFIE